LALVFTTCSELWKVLLFGDISLWCFCLHVKSQGTTKRTCTTEDVWQTNLNVKVKVTRDKNIIFSALSVACAWFMFGKTSLVSG